LARRFGTEEVTEPGDAFSAAVRRVTGGVGADAVIITAGSDSNAPIVQAGSISRDRGRVVIVGAVRADIPRSPFFEREIDVRFSRSYGPGRYDPSYEEKGHDYPIGYVRWTEQRNMQAIIDLLGSGRLEVAPLVSHRYPIARATEAYTKLTSGTEATGILLTYEAAPARSTRVEIRAPSARRPGAIGLGLVGAGSFARGVLLPAIKAVPEIELRGVVTATGLSARHAADHSSFAYGTTDLDELLGDQRVDAVVIATRHGQHADQVVAALAAGKHVFVEKPLCTSADDLPRIRDAFDEAQGRFGPRTLLVGFNRRFAPHSRRLQQLLSGRRGPLSMHYRVNAGFIPPESWVHDPAEGGGRLIGEGCHFLDWMRDMAAASPLRVFAESVDTDGAVVTARFADGSVGTLQYVTNGNAALAKERAEVHSEGFSAVLDDFTALTWHGPSASGSDTLKLQDKGHRLEVAEFLDAVRTGRQPIPVDQLFESMRMTFAAVDSIMTSSVRELDE
jgi:predicted dehydrogenase